MDMGRPFVGEDDPLQSALWSKRQMTKKVLIVDDEVFIRALLEQTLEDFEVAGVEVFSVGNGEQAWEIIQAERPDLLILDVMMPGLSGYEVCDLVKKDPELAKIHVIMLTARGQEVDRQRSVEVGADEYITKPFDPDYVIERTAAVLDVKV